MQFNLKAVFKVLCHKGGIMKKVVLGLIIIASHSVAMAWSLFGPKTYEECVLQNMKGTTSDAAAKHIESACNDKYETKPVPVQKCKSREPSLDELKKIQANGGVEDGGMPRFRATIYNGNANVSIDEMVVLLKGSNFSSPQQYKLSFIPIQPLSSGTASVQVQKMPGKNFSWDWGLRVCEIDRKTK